MLHVPVLLEESLDFLLNDLSGTYLDLTFGRGSHSQEILNRLSSSGKLCAVDRDVEAITYGQLNIHDERFAIHFPKKIICWMYTRDMSKMKKYLMCCRRKYLQFS